MTNKELYKFFIYLQHQIDLLGSNCDSELQLTHNQKHYLSQQLNSEIEQKLNQLERKIKLEERDF